MSRHLTGAALLALAVSAPAQLSAATFLTDSAVFSANSEGHNWNGWIWNTQAKPDDSWNAYYSDSTDPSAPQFINDGTVAADEVNPGISIELAPGVYDFIIYGEAPTLTVDALQHFVLNLYFNGDQSAPAISGLYGPSCLSVCAAGHPNGLDLWGDSGAAEAGTLNFADGDLNIALTGFTWAIGTAVDEVWPHWSDVAPYGGGSGMPDFVGHVQLTVTSLAAVPIPAALPLLGGALGLLAGIGRRRRRAS